jgi:PAS domain S-box-containing protein
MLCGVGVGVTFVLGTLFYPGATWHLLIVQLVAIGLLMVAAARSSGSLLKRLRVEQRALELANASLGRRVRDEQALAGIGRLLVEGDEVDASFRPALARLHEVWGRPVALFVRGPDRPRSRHHFGFRAPVLVGGDDEAARIVAEDSGGVVEVIDGAKHHRCRAVPIRTGALPHGVLVADLGDDAGPGDDDALLIGAGTLFAAAFEWRDAAGRMRLAERRRGALVKSSPDGLLILDDGGVIVDANPAANALFGTAAFAGAPRTEPLLGRSFADIDAVSAEDLRKIARALSDSREGRPGAGGVDFVGLSLGRGNGGTAHVEMRVVHAQDDDGVGRFDMSLREITGRVEALRQREKLEQQLFAARRLEALGQLAGGVAHDFNNLLSVILTNARLMGEQKDLDDAARADLAEIVDCGKRAAELTSQLLTFARQQRRELKVVDLAAVARGVEKLLRRLTPADVGIDMDLQSSWLVVADPAQLEQVLVNLIANARDAMPTGGTCTVSTRNLDASAGPLPAGLPDAGRYVELVVADAGTGMDEETKSHVFEPFFTTKPTGKGVGLGLATVYGIVKQSAGHISVESSPGSGTTFRVWLPERGTLLRNEDETPAAGDAVSLGRERILVVDDDDGVRRATERALSSRGFIVLSATSAAAAEVMAEGGVDAVVADLVMPGLAGDVLVGNLRRKVPLLPAVLLTGYGPRSVELARPFRILRKPVSPDELARTLRAVIDEVPQR